MRAFYAEIWANSVPQTVRRQLLAAVILFAISRILAFAGPWPDLSDTKLYGDYAIRGVDQGQVAYRDFAIEYPPLAWELIALPRLLAFQRCSGEPTSEEIAHCQAAYCRAFRAMMGAFDIASLALMWAIARAHWPNRLGSIILAYVIITASSLYLLYDRLDLGLSLLLLIWSSTWLRSTTAGKGVGWQLASFAMLGLSVAFKAIPILILPYLLLAEWRSQHRWFKWLGFVSFAGALAVPFAVLAPKAGLAPLGFIQFHTERGVQVESIYATLLTIFSWFGSDVQVVYTHGADELIGAGAPELKLAARILLIAWLTGTGFWCLRQGPRFDRKKAWQSATLAMLGAVALAPVLSPQYFVWALPLVLLVAADVLPAQGPAWRWLIVGAISVAALTTLVFPCTYFGLVDKLQPDEDRRLIPLAHFLLGLRNLVYLAIVVGLGRSVFCGSNSQRRQDSGLATGNPPPTGGA
jgi:hypothetical protein